MGKNKFLEPFSDAKVWLHWFIIALVVSTLFGFLGIGTIFATIVIAVTDVVVEKLLGI